MVTSGSTAPEGSVTVPKIVPNVVCADVGCRSVVTKSTVEKMMTASRIAFIPSPLLSTVDLARLETGVAGWLARCYCKARLSVKVKLNQDLESLCLWQC